MLEPVPAMAVGESRNLTCRVVEVAPVGNLTVTLRRGAETLRTESFGAAEGSASVAVSHLLTAGPGDHGQDVTCHAELSLRPHGPLFARAAVPLKLSVFGESSPRGRAPALARMLLPGGKEPGSSSAPPCPCPHPISSQSPSHLHPSPHSHPSPISISIPVPVPSPFPSQSRPHPIPVPIPFPIPSPSHPNPIPISSQSLRDWPAECHDSNPVRGALLPCAKSLPTLVQRLGPCWDPRSRPAMGTSPPPSR